jgi:heme-degrading monooxygenase HmoA
MAVVVTNVIPGGSQDLYESVAGKVMPGDQLPEGCRLHVAGPINEGWRVVTVWDSEDAFDRFRQGKLLPTLQEVAGDEAPTPEVRVDPVHKVVTS